MEKGKRINGEIKLPKLIIQQIQSHLNGKQAAQTCVVSKLWYHAWLTNPNLDFDVRYFREIWDFINFLTKTMERYKELNLKIVKFRLGLERIEHGSSVSFSPSNELIIKALQMGVSDLNLEFRSPFWRPTKLFSLPDLPHEVLETETLIRLSVTGCRIDRLVDRKVLCSRLESLSLTEVCAGENVVSDIISSCPLIENLSLSECKYFVGSSKSAKDVKLRSPLIEFRQGNDGSVVDGTIKVSAFHKLKCLSLQKVNLGEKFFSDFSLKFPCLEDLSLHYCLGCKERYQITSNSLKCISLTPTTTRRLCFDFDVPNICNFSFSGMSLPQLSFTSVLNKFESHISISHHRRHLKASWFHQLKSFLIELIRSNISISLRFSKIESIDRLTEIDGLPRPVLKNLVISLDEPLSAFSSDNFLDGIFWSCCSKVITIHEFHRSHLLEVLCNRLMRQVNENYWIPNQTVFGQSGLEEVNVESFKKTLNEWRSLPWQAFSGSLNAGKIKEQFRFRLEWSAC